MSTEEVAKALNELAKLIAESTPDIVQTAALTAKALIVDRLQEEGLDANEVQLAPYNPEYKKFKQKNYGYIENFTNLTLTGNMLKRLEIISEGATSKGYEVVIGEKLQEDKDKVNYNSQHYGDILRTSKAEEERLQKGIDEYYKKLITQAGL